MINQLVYHLWQWLLLDLYSCAPTAVLHVRCWPCILCGRVRALSCRHFLFPWQAVFRSKGCISIRSCCMQSVLHLLHLLVCHSPRSITVGPSVTQPAAAYWKVFPQSLHFTWVLQPHDAAAYGRQGVLVMPQAWMEAGVSDEVVSVAWTCSWLACTAVWSFQLRCWSQCVDKLLCSPWGAVVVQVMSLAG